MCALWVKNSKVENAADKRKMLLGILSDIYDQRAKIKLEFGEGVTSIKELSASLIKYDLSGVTVEVSALKSASSNWLGATVSCFFRIRDRETTSHSQFLTFSNVISAVQLQPNGMVWFVLTLPEKCTNAQQRRCVRVNVDQGRIPEISVWRELLTGVMIADRAPLWNSATDTKRGFKIGNISTSGLRLLVQNSLMHEIQPKPNKGEAYSIHFKAVVEPGDPEESFWVTAFLRNIFSDPQEGITSLGFEFSAEGALDDSGRIVWQQLKYSEVNDLGPYIFRWNLTDFHREKRIE